MRELDVLADEAAARISPVLAEHHERGCCRGETCVEVDNLKSETAKAVVPADDEWVWGFYSRNADAWKWAPPAPDLVDEPPTVIGNLRAAIIEAVLDIVWDRIERLLDAANTPASPDARLEAATAALAERWYAYGPDGPTGHGWMREIAAAALNGAEQARTCAA